MNAKLLVWCGAVVGSFVLGRSSVAQVSPGFRLFGPVAGTDTHLVDTNGVIVHTWPSPLPAGAGVYLLDDGTLLRTGKTAGGPGIGGVGGAVLRIDLDGTILWEFHYSNAQHWLHHDVEPLPNGHVLMLAWQNKTVAQALAAGRDPALVSGTVMRPDSVIEVKPTGPFTGTIVWEWHVWDHLIQDFDPTKANYGVVSDHPELVDVNYPHDASGFDDWNHMNSLKYDAVHDRIIVSAREQNEIWVIDHSTTTAEAAGHTGGKWGKGGDLLYRYGNPEAYGRGGPADQVFFGQHAARVIPPGYPGAGNYTVFNNSPPGGSVVWEFTPPLDATGNFVLAPGAAYGPSGPVWTFSDPNMHSALMSSAERLPNGNTLICSALQGGVGEVTPAGEAVWTYELGAFVFHAHYVERRLWSDRISLDVSAGGTVGFELIAGSAFAGHYYLLLASAAGTMPGITWNGITLPLNEDPLMHFSVQNANGAILNGTLGVLDGLGRAQPALSLPPGVTGPGVAHFAAAVVDPAGYVFTAATNPQALQLIP
jgi:hypothetical protein